MQGLWKFILIIAVFVILIYLAFQFHWALGVAVIAGLIGYSVFANRATFHAVKANAAYARGDREKALELLEKAYSTKPRKPQHALYYAFMLMREGKPEPAESVLKELLQSSRDGQFRMQVKSQLATACWLLGKQDEAIQMLEEVHEQYKTVTIVGNLGYFKILKGDDLEAALAFNLAAYEYESNDVTIIDNVAQNYYFLGRYEEAAEMYEKVVEKSPRHADSHYYYAKTLEALGRHEEAAEQAKLALEKPLAMVTSLAKDDLEKLHAKYSEEA